MYPEEPSTSAIREGAGRRGDPVAVFYREAGDRAQEALSTRADQDGPPECLERFQLVEQEDVLLHRLGKPESWIDDRSIQRNPGRRRAFESFAQLGQDAADNIALVLSMG